VPLFDEKKRVDPHHQRPAENTYQFLDRVDDPVFARVRATFNEWVARFASLQATEATSDLVGRFRSKQDPQFYAAFWELYLHELHVRLGYDVSVHPDSDRGTRPDFMLSRRGKVAYLEAVMTTPSSLEPSQPGSVRIVVDHVDSAHDPDFFLKLRFVIAGDQTPRKAEVVRAVQTWLRSLDWQEWWRGGLSPDIPYPEAELPVRGWLLALRALPRAPDRRGEKGEHSRMIGMYPSVTGFVESVAEAIKPKLDEKANKYGDLDAPYVIALWTMATLASDETAPEALFGIDIPLETGRHRTGLPSPVHRDGLWTSNRPHRGRVSGVLAAKSWDFNYSAVSRAMPRLWVNPWATCPLDHALPYPTSRVSQDEIWVENTSATIAPSDFFGLAPDWPGTPFRRAARR
jgi:hypothetical protein